MVFCEILCTQYCSQWNPTENGILKTSAWFCKFASSNQLFNKKATYNLAFYSTESKIFPHDPTVDDELNLVTTFKSEVLKTLNCCLILGSSNTNGLG